MDETISPCTFLAIEALIFRNLLSFKDLKERDFNLNDFLDIFASYISSPHNIGHGVIGPNSEIPFSPPSGVPHLHDSPIDETVLVVRLRKTCCKHQDGYADQEPTGKFLSFDSDH